MRRYTLHALWICLAIFTLAAAPAQAYPPPTSTATESPAQVNPLPAPTATESPCPPFLEDVCATVVYIQQKLGLPSVTWVIILIAAVLIVVVWFFRGILSRSEEFGKSLPGILLSPIRYGVATWRYLGDFIELNRYFGFRGMEWLMLEPIDLDQAYVPLDLLLEKDIGENSDVVPDNEAFQITGKERMLEGQVKPVDITVASKKRPRLAIIGDAGSGKSALLQWVGLSAAKHLRWKRLTGAQRDFVKAVKHSRLKPLIPILIPLREYQEYCKDKKVPQGQETLWHFLDGYAGRKFPALKLPADYFTWLLRKGCLLMLDGVDEIDLKLRPVVRDAVEGIICQGSNHKRNRYIITTRPSAANIAVQLPDFRQAHVQPLTPEKRQGLLELWCSAVYPTRSEAINYAKDLLPRMESENIRPIAETPLMVNIIGMVYFHKHHLPSQRAELFEFAVEALLVDYLHKKGMSVVDEEEWGGMDWKQRREALSVAAFYMHDNKLESFQASELIAQERFWKLFGVDQATACDAAEAFLSKIAGRGGLLRQDGWKYDFYIRLFREFLAGRYLAKELKEEWLERLQKYVTDPQWEEAIQLAAGFLAFDQPSEAKKFIQLLRGLRGTEAQCDHAIALAGLSLVDLLNRRSKEGEVDQQAQRLLVDEKRGFPEPMKAALVRNPPTIRLHLRYKLGLALGELGDPRFRENEAGILLPEMVPVEADPFRMGSSAEDEQRLKAQEERIWPDEQPDHMLELPAYSIGKYPVTNAEFRVFYQQHGYENTKELWSPQGRRWRMGDWEPDLTYIPEELRERWRDWLAGRPPEKRDRPFFWDDPAFSANNLPVVGVSWFEAEAYCIWLSQVSGQNYRLPSEAEWEQAARGAEGRLWPWGNEWEALKCNCEESNEAFRGTTPVGMYPDGASPCGALDMAGNVWEWTRSLYQDYPYVPGDEREDPARPGPRVVRGGSWGDDRYNARCAFRGWYVPDYFYNSIGFRLLLSPK